MPGITEKVSLCEYDNSRIFSEYFVIIGALKAILHKGVYERFPLNVYVGWIKSNVSISAASDRIAVVYPDKWKAKIILRVCPLILDISFST